MNSKIANAVTSPVKKKKKKKRQEKKRHSDYCTLAVAFANIHYYTNFILQI